MLSTPIRYLMSSSLVLGLLVGCSSTPPSTGSGAPVAAMDGSRQPGASSHSAFEYFGTPGTGIAREGGIPEGEEFDDDYYYSPYQDQSASTTPTNALEVRTIYFAFDSSEIHADFIDIVRAHGMALASNPNLVVTVEGHCDERGSREYNIGLGERRANTVKRMLMAQGARAQQIVTISYGEERPVALGSNEQAWALNRRSELVY